MHGADRDTVWLQRDFGIYICNLFDTGQASKLLKLERNSLEHLLHHFCDVTANKEYQNADWRLRPLPDEMIRYAREDTYYLLYTSTLLSYGLDFHLLFYLQTIIAIASIVSMHIHRDVTRSSNIKAAKKSISISLNADIVFFVDYFALEDELH